MNRPTQHPTHLVLRRRILLTSTAAAALCLPGSSHAQSSLQAALQPGHRVTLITSAHPAPGVPCKVRSVTADSVHCAGLFHGRSLRLAEIDRVMTPKTRARRSFMIGLLSVSGLAGGLVVVATAILPLLVVSVPLYVAAGVVLSLGVPGVDLATSEPGALLYQAPQPGATP